MTPEGRRPPRTSQTTHHRHQGQQHHRPGRPAPSTPEARLPRPMPETNDEAFTRTSHHPSRSRSGSTQATCRHPGPSAVCSLPGNGSRGAWHRLHGRQQPKGFSALVMPSSCAEQYWRTCPIRRSGNRSSHRPGMARSGRGSYLLFALDTALDWLTPRRLGDIPVSARPATHWLGFDGGDDPLQKPVVKPS